MTVESMYPPGSAGTPADLYKVRVPEPRQPVDQTTKGKSNA